MSSTRSKEADLQTDAFLSEEDLDLRNLSERELYRYWNMWLKQAQATNECDRKVISHGVFTEEK